MRSLLGYVAASRAAQGGQKAFMDATKFLVANMLRSMSKKLEIEMFYGQKGYAQIASAAGAVLTITTAEWAPGIWAGAEGMPIEIRDLTGATSRGEFIVKSVDMTLQTVTLTSVPSGIVATDVIWHKGAFGNEFPGIHQIITSTGVLFNIDTSIYNLFKGNTYDALGGSLSFNKLQSAAAVAVEKGLDSDLYCLVNPRAWADMMSDQAALRRYDDSYSATTVENGGKAIKFHSQNGVLEIEPSIYVKQGYAFMISTMDWFRVGSTDLTFRQPGQGEDYFRHLENAAAFELRLYSDQALFCHAPGKSVLIKNIVN